MIKIANIRGLQVACRVVRNNLHKTLLYTFIHHKIRRQMNTTDLRRIASLASLQTHRRDDLGLLTIAMHKKHNFPPSIIPQADANHHTHQAYHFFSVIPARQPCVRPAPVPTLAWYVPGLGYDRMICRSGIFYNVLK